MTLISRGREGNVIFRNHLFLGGWPKKNQDTSRGKEKPM